MNKVELLAPAGDFSCLKAAIEAGCDAFTLEENFLELVLFHLILQMMK